MLFALFFYHTLAEEETDDIMGAIHDIITNLAECPKAHRQRITHLDGRSHLAFMIVLCYKQEGPKEVIETRVKSVVQAFCSPNGVHLIDHLILEERPERLVGIVASRIRKPAAV